MQRKYTRRGETQRNNKSVICPPCGEQSLAPEGFNPGVAVATKEGQNRNKTLWPLLPRLTAVLPPQGREMPCGFTLIELLVVVLIIGILAAVAVPQYQLAVKKGKFVQLRALADSLAKAAHVYYVSSGNWPQRFSELDLALPGNMQVVETTANRESCLECAVSTDFYCCLLLPVRNMNTGAISCSTTDFYLAYNRRFAEMWGEWADLYTCSQLTGKENFCEKLPGATPSSGIAIMTPNGWQGGRKFFTFL